jgi:hypothetical protein
MDIFILLKSLEIFFERAEVYKRRIINHPSYLNTTCYVVLLISNFFGVKGKMN